MSDHGLYRVVAFTDNVGYACTMRCGHRAVRDINADNPGADAGIDPIHATRVAGHCMGCGKDLRHGPEAKRLEHNVESRSKADHHGEIWTPGDLEFLAAFFEDAHGDPSKEAEVAEALGRTIEACRQRFYEYKSGQGASRQVEYRSTTTTTTTRTTTTTHYIGAMDDPEDQWWSPGYYNQEGE